MSSASKECSHGAGALLAGHNRCSHGKEPHAQAQGEADEGEGEEEAQQPGPEDDVIDLTITPLDPGKLAEQLARDCKARGVWPIRAGAAGCPVLERAVPFKWNEYRWVKQSYVDRSGKLKENSIQVMKEVTGTRPEFLATFKRKLLQWLPHRLHHQWDSMWQKKRRAARAPVSDIQQSAPVSDDCSERARNMCVGEVDVRIDFIQNAELRTPNQVQREFFVHQYASLLCAVLQWKTCINNETVLHTRTIMFMSDDKKHDGAFAAHALNHLALEVLAHALRVCLFVFRCLCLRDRSHCCHTPGPGDPETQLGLAMAGLDYHERQRATLCTVVSILSPHSNHTPGFCARSPLLVRLPLSRSLSVLCLPLLHMRTHRTRCSSPSLSCVVSRKRHVRS
jgi:hypothetical protein